MFNFEKKVLSNGLRVITVPMKNTEAVTLLVLVGVGSRYETKRINGISHFLEHLFFKGTKSRPNAGDIHKELDRIGAEHNAFTSKELTGFWVKTSDKDFNIGLDIVSDILLEPLFKKEEIDRERGVILQEISMYEDIPQQKVVEVLSEVMHGDQPAGWPITGIKNSVANIDRLNILEYKKDNYVAQNMVLIIVGNITKNTFKKIEKFFRNIKKGKVPEEKKAKILQKESASIIINKKTDQSHLAIGLRSYSMFDEHRYALNLLSVILGGNMSSRLFMEIREKLGLAYYVGSGVGLQRDIGTLGIRAGISHENLDLIVNKIKEIIKDIKENGVSKKELDDAKSYTRGQMALNFETTDQVADFYGEQEIFYNKILQPEAILKKIEKVSQRDIIKIARDIFMPDKINMAVIGDHKEIKKNQERYKKIFSKI